MQVRCINSLFPFYKDGQIYEIVREFIGNAGDSKGIHYTEIRTSHGMVTQVETSQLINGNANFVYIY